ncbi:hypothetical protein CPAV1605_1426 [seawater metagenome]|uniref:Uncharacterized protein n=1 Tax=seawater metagenome TaxID=1561972 RepID=A0A5E8CKC1_9ZZZZ
MSLKTIIIICIIVWILYQLNDNKNGNKVENMDGNIKTVQTNLEDTQFVLDDIDTAERVFIQQNPENKMQANVHNLPLPAASFRSDICRTQYCASCDCYNPILMGICKTECNIDPCNCTDGKC